MLQNYTVLMTLTILHAILDSSKMDRDQLKIKMNVKKYFEILRGIVAENEIMISDILELFEEVINDNTKSGCKKINETLLNMTQSVIKSANITKKAWSGFIPLLKSMNGAFECKYYMISSY